MEDLDTLVGRSSSLLPLPLRVGGPGGLGVVASELELAAGGCVWYAMVDADFDRWGV
jgi:hypothetical protein